MTTTRKQYPRPPEELLPEARTEWYRCMRGFYRYDFIGELDRGVLAAYCQSYGRWAEAETALKSVDDSVAANLLIGIANTALRDLAKFANMLGMSPLSRARILATSAGPPVGKKEGQFRDAKRIAKGQFGPSAPPRLVLVDVVDEDELR